MYRRVWTTYKRNNVLIITTAEHKNEKLKQSEKKLKRNIFMRNAFHCVLLACSSLMTAQRSILVHDDDDDDE